jgi:hypothetical protein
MRIVKPIEDCKELSNHAKWVTENTIEISDAQPHMIWKGKIYKVPSTDIVMSDALTGEHLNIDNWELISLAGEGK